MKKEIKFRAWNKEYKHMEMFKNGKNRIEYCQGELSVSPGWDSYDRPTYENDTSCEYEIMQYTGLKDKNGNDIYEGDIVTLNVLCEPERGKGKYWQDKIFNVTYADQCFLPFGLKDSKVIGNIYQNPELIGDL